MRYLPPSNRAIQIRHKTTNTQKKNEEEEEEKFIVRSSKLNCTVHFQRSLLAVNGQIRRSRLDVGKVREISRGERSPSKRSSE